MNDLIKVDRDSSGKQTVNARELHEFLESKQEFAHWIKGRINQYGFVEGVDFISYDNFIKRDTGGTTRKEYDLTIPMAKELSMVERNEKGKQARLYFLECERMAKDPIYVLNDPASMRQLLLTYSEKCIEQEKTIEQQKPKVLALDRLATANGSECITDAAKNLQIHPVKTLFQWLAANGWTYKRAGGRGNWIAYQRRIQQGVLEHKITTVARDDGSEKTTFQVLVTPKGLSVLAQIFEGKDNIFA